MNIFLFSFFHSSAFVHVVALYKNPVHTKYITVVQHSELGVLYIKTAPNQSGILIAATTWKRIKMFGTFVL